MLYPENDFVLRYTWWIYGDTRYHCQLGLKPSVESPPDCMQVQVTVLNEQHQSVFLVFEHSVPSALNVALKGLQKNVL